MRKVLLLLFFLTLFLGTGFAQTPVQVSPVPVLQFFDSDGLPLVGGLLYTYAAGTTTPQATYTSSTGTIPNSNPVVLDAGGRASVWLSAASYKFILKTSQGSTLWTQDNVSVAVFANGNTTFKGNNTFTGTATFNGPIIVNAGGSLNGTFTGNPNFSGNPTFTNAITSSQFISTALTGTPPLVVSSTTLVPNLDVDLLNGVLFPSSAPLNSVPIISNTSPETASWQAIPDCETLSLTNQNFVQFLGASHALVCGHITFPTIPASGSNVVAPFAQSISTPGIQDVSGVNVTITTSGGNVLVFATCPADDNAHSTGAPWGYYSLNEDGSDTGLLSSFGVFGDSAAFLTPTVQYLFTGVAAGTHTFKLRVTLQLPANLILGRNVNSVITAIELPH